MSYPALPDRRMPYHRDGTVVAAGRLYTGVTGYVTGSQLINVNGATMASHGGTTAPSGLNPGFWFFFPEQREITALYAMATSSQPGGGPAWPREFTLISGSNDTTNGLDGTWEVASVTGTNTNESVYDWRSSIKALSFTGGKSSLRFFNSVTTDAVMTPYLFHVYGEKAAGETPDDIIFINHQDTPGVEYTAPQDFGDRPLGTTVTHQFRVKNASATKTANTVNLQCNDSDFAISEDGVTWVVTINIASLAAGAESATLYVRCTSPAPGALLGPRFAEIVATVGSWT